MAGVPDGQEAIRTMTDALVAAQTADEAVTAFLDHLGRVLGLKTAWVFRLDPRLHTFRPAAYVHLPPALAGGDVRALRVGSCECQRQFRRGELHAAANIVTCSRLEGARGDRGGLSCHASLPLRQGARVLGILNVAAPGPEPLDPEMLQTLEVASGTLSVALDRAELWQRSQRRLAGLERVVEAGLSLSRVDSRDALLWVGVTLARTVTRSDVAAVVGPDGRIDPVDGEGRSDGKASRRSVAQDVLTLGAPVGTRMASSPHGPWQVHGPRIFERSRSGIWASLGDGNGDLVVESRRPDGLDAEDAEVIDRWAGSLAQALEALRERERDARAAALEERQRIARDLHDRVNQRLFSASLAVSSAASLQEAGRTGEIGASLDLARGQLRAAQDEMRSLVHALRPEREEIPIDLLDTLRDLAASLEAVDGPRIEVELGSVPAGVRPEVRTALVQIASEALHNALRHARASRVVVTLSARGERLELEVADDGVGIGDRRGTDGMGLSNMRRRAREVCGTVRIGPVETDPGAIPAATARNGTRVRVRVPRLGCRTEPRDSRSRRQRDGEDCGAQAGHHRSGARKSGRHARGGEVR